VGIVTSATTTEESWIERVKTADLDRARDIITAYRQNGHGMRDLFRYGVRHPDHMLELASAVVRLPRLEVNVSRGSRGDAMFKRLARRRFTALGWYPAETALVLPDDEATYLRGKSRQALRTNVTRARKEGLRCMVVTEEAERKRLAEELYSAAYAEGAADFIVYLEDRDVGGPIEMHVAVDAEDNLAAMCQVAVDDEAAMVDIFLKMPDHPSSSDARYLLHLEIVKSLIERNVRMLLVESSRLHVAPGTQYFQRRVGFDAYNVRVRRSG
jgi:hypothetical protein